MASDNQRSLHAVKYDIKVSSRVGDTPYVCGEQEQPGKAKAVINIIPLRSRNLLDLRQLMSYRLSARSPH
jgi:hypothetical protein